MFRARYNWFRVLNRFKLAETRSPFSSKPTSTSGPSNGGDKAESSLTKFDESYRQLDNLDFMTAAKILFTDSPKKKKFGLDFHLVQLFFALMPSLAVYLVAQYARYEMRRMEEELEQKKKKEEEGKAKELELKAIEEKEAGSNPELSEVKTRLDKLEETIKEIVVESKKHSGSGVVKNQESDNKKKQLAGTEASSSKISSESSTSIEKEPLNRQDFPEQRPGESSPVSNPRKSQYGTLQDGGISHDDKR
ncbi:stress response NST1-like protein [Trema orientale]|uniref:Stress response NST1-like protein n=1 Tax=Trema orientale TaxID=63057 RepID=A0A2P5E612_TREOI|nr:stress response NST1-like protein [Trema orientale]